MLKLDRFSCSQKIWLKQDPPVSDFERTEMHGNLMLWMDVMVLTEGSDVLYCVVGLEIRETHSVGFTCCNCLGRWHSCSASYIINTRGWISRHPVHMHTHGLVFKHLHWYLDTGPNIWVLRYRYRMSRSQMRCQYINSMSKFGSRYLYTGSYPDIDLGVWILDHVSRCWSIFLDIVPGISVLVLMTGYRSWHSNIGPAVHIFSQMSHYWPGYPDVSSSLWVLAQVPGYKLRHPDSCGIWI